MTGEFTWSQVGLPSFNFPDTGESKGSQTVAKFQTSKELPGLTGPICFLLCHLHFCAILWFSLCHLQNNKFCIHVPWTTHFELNMVEKDIRLQYDCDAWHRPRKFRPTASNFGLICKIWKDYQKLADGQKTANMYHCNEKRVETQRRRSTLISTKTSLVHLAT